MAAALFEETVFDVDLGFATVGGPTRKTYVTIMGSGAESRVAQWANSRRKYDIVISKLSIDDQARVRDWFEAMNAQLIGFRVLDPLDFQSCKIGNYVNPISPAFNDQAIAMGDGATKVFQLYKNYTVGSRTWARKIRKPITGTVRIGIAGVKQNSGFSVDYTTGLVTFVSAPVYGALITAGFQFHVPVRINSDALQQNLTDPGAAETQSFPLMELSEKEMEQT